MDKNILEKDVQFIKGVGPQKVNLLNKLGIYKLEDIITYFPRNMKIEAKATKNK